MTSNRPQQTISQNALPGNPIPSVRDSFGGIGNGLKSYLDKVKERILKQEYSDGRNSFAISAVVLPLGFVRLGFESKIRVSGMPGFEVSKMTLLLDPDGNLFGQPKSHFHKQSATFQPGLTRKHLNGSEAGIKIADTILEGLETHGIDFLNQLEGLYARDYLATALLGVQKALFQKERTFGRGGIDKGPDSVFSQRASDFRIAAGELQVSSLNGILGDR